MVYLIILYFFELYVRYYRPTQTRAVQTTFDNIQSAAPDF